MNQDQSEVKRKGRGKGRKPALVYVALRIPQETLTFYNRFENRQDAMRGALNYYIEQYYQVKEQQDAN